MAQDPEAFANMVVMTVKAAMAPVLADVKSLQTQIAGWESRWNDLGTLRERVAVVEAKSVTELRHEPVVTSSEPVDLTPVLERLASAEALLKAQGDLRDRVLVVETKAATPLQPSAELGLFEKRLTAMETTQAIPTAAEIMLGDVKSRLTALETRAPELPAVLESKAVDLSPVEQRLSRLELQYEMKAGELTPLSTAVADLTKDFGVIRERLAVAETRAGVPGPPGQDGKAGADGFGLEDFSVDFDGDRTLALKFERGSVKKTALFQLPFLKYQGVYQDGQSYAQGDVVTWAGSTWTALTATASKPGDGSKDWVLCVKKGRDGRDGQSAPGALPVITVGSR